MWRRSPKMVGTLDLSTAIEALKIAEQKIREVRQGLEAQLRRDKQLEILRLRPGA